MIVLFKVHPTIVLSPFLKSTLSPEIVGQPQTPKHHHHLHHYLTSRYRNSRACMLMVEVVSSMKHRTNGPDSISPRVLSCKSVKQVTESSHCKCPHKSVMYSGGLTIVLIRKSLETFKKLVDLFHIIIHQKINQSLINPSSEKINLKTHRTTHLSLIFHAFKMIITHSKWKNNRNFSKPTVLHPKIKTTTTSVNLVEASISSRRYCLKQNLLNSHKKLILQLSKEKNWLTVCTPTTNGLSEKQFSPDTQKICKARLLLMSKPTENGKHNLLNNVDSRRPTKAHLLWWLSKSRRARCRDYWNSTTSRKPFTITKSTTNK